MPVLYAAMALLGLAIGSFLNVVIYRVPAAESVFSPPSACPNCGAPIRNRHNIPVLGWLILRGKCKDCKAPISVRYPLVELLTGALFVATTWRIAQLDVLPALPAYLYFVAIGIALAMIDMDCQRLPDSIVLPSYPVLLLLLTGASTWTHDWSALLRALIGGLALYAFYFAIAFAYPAGMGFGDVKLSGLLGGMLAYLSYQTLLVGAIAAFLFGGLIGAAVMASRRGSRKTKIPFGPFMILGSMVAIFAAEPISDSYVRLMIGA